MQTSGTIGIVIGVTFAVVIVLILLCLRAHTPDGSGHPNREVREMAAARRRAGRAGGRGGRGGAVAGNGQQGPGGGGDGHGEVDV